MRMSLELESVHPDAQKFLNPGKHSNFRKRGSPSPREDLPHDSEDISISRLQRRLKARHLQMIALGGTIGTGLFIGSGIALARGGPVGSLIGFAFIGTIVYSIMMSLGEMAAFIPVSGSFCTYTIRFVDPAAGFAMGYVYWFSWAVTFALEITAAALIIQYWTTAVPNWILITIFWIVISAVNFFSVSIYGEVEFWISSVKVATIVGFIVLGLCLTCGAGKDGFVGFRYWNDPGPFAYYLVNHKPVGKFMGFYAVLIQALFSYQGTELVGVAAGESENPTRNVPIAIRRTFWRIVCFFVLSILFIGLLVPSNNLQLFGEGMNASYSPFVIAINMAGIKVLPDIMNGVILLVVLSAGNSDVYSGSRILLGLANEGLGPRILCRVNRQGVPYVSVAVTVAFGALAFLNVSEHGGRVFLWLLHIIAVAGSICWAFISLSHIRFMKALKAQNISRDALPFKAPWQPWFSWYGFISVIFILITQGFDVFFQFTPAHFFADYLSIILFFVLAIGYKLIKRSEWVNLDYADLYTGRKDAETIVWSPPEPKNIWEQVWAKIS
ncbi:Arginine permease [Neolecta irregularis DAH-3]|uniref:Arginine permease n=1 Tax=Neolecta irregularis (strain DAH-3) TaxID=1198029 RepID=A0A1U7LV22_NEOID|nr:Arginine permease [Neolecta irregularis DAH-3]|eukprot:OLL26520.1 Arginine permease [Neolecta irregularis DAH-3]